jgi:DNA invertase Pin-like site-specific DNA recombinase
VQKISDQPEPHKIGYARVSTADQDLRLQIDALLRDGVSETNIYREFASGASKRRPQFSAMMKEIRPGDVVTVWKLDRLGRSLRQMLDTVDRIHKAGAKLRVLTQQIDTSTPSGSLFLRVFGAIAEFERELIRERTFAGLAAARERGRIGGRRPTYTDAQVREAMVIYDRGGTSWEKVAREVGISATRLLARARELRRRDAEQT